MYLYKPNISRRIKSAVVVPHSKIYGFLYKKKKTDDFASVRHFHMYLHLIIDTMHLHGATGAKITMNRISFWIVLLMLFYLLLILFSVAY